MQRLPKCICSFLLLAVFSQSVSGQEESNNNTVNITTTAVPFLRISPDPRAGGMGDVGIAVSPDASSVFYNAAKIPFARQKAAIGAIYTPWLKEVADDVYLAALSGFYQLDESQSLSASLRYFSMGDLSIVDYNGNKLTTASPREFALDIAYSRKLSDRIGVAAALRYINSRLATGNISGVDYKTGNAVAGDISFYYNGLSEDKKGWTAGVTLSNLGSKIGYTSDADEKDFLPASLGLGAAYAESWDEDNQVSFGVDINKLLVPELPATGEGMKAYRDKGVVGSWIDGFGNKAWQAGFGMEYSYKEQLHLRLGYTTRTYEAGNWQSLTAGIGLQFSVAAVNFSYLIPTGSAVNNNPLRNTVRFGLLFNWDSK
ncbi:MAG: type IX secretion system outer membrane channel protein PorV [Candidatus Pseudobacter hemicellulosilyticus]|uniref:Type IX secretion system outer membrane channel protein PorV n=1 Tax=Candidatus Pseudobacter hemicellulosilyticus TaxID=3121375 RepID=A0AAJ6BF47_9BACT|nr:MAG: type IX secretion system outer membrane channel protein PorV [Pseudobacter sp.]